MKTIKYLLSIVLLAASIMPAQSQSELRSRRSSIYSILVKHTDQQYADEIERQFRNIPISPRFNDHNLSVRVVTVNSKIKKDRVITDFVDRNMIASRMVAKWFDRDGITGVCTMDTIKSRGLYDASTFDVELASRSTRGLAMLEDAGEDLIANTYLLVNDISYVDKAKRSAVWGVIGSIAMGALMAAGGGSVDDVTDIMDNTNTIISSYKGFSVKIRTRLYRLRWNAEDAHLMYNDLWLSSPNEQKASAFETARNKFVLEYVAEVESSGKKTSFMGISEEEPFLMVRKACSRAIDENIVDLQRKYEPFRIKTPIVVSADGQIFAPIGMKEGINVSSKFEVLEAVEKNGKVSYHRVGTVKPIPGKIWDNRFMASEEGAANADLASTYFKTESGSNFASGMLIREIY